MAGDEETPPLLILHHLPNFKLSIFALLRSKYTVLDPPHPSFQALSKAARLMLCAGPTPVTAAVLDTYPALECVVGSSAGINHFGLAACRRRRGLRLRPRYRCSAPGLRRGSVCAGLALGPLPKSMGLPQRYCIFFYVSGKRVGIVGLGSIGSRVAKRFESFGCTIAYTSTKEKPNIPYTFHPNAALLASNADILVVCTDETRHLINTDVMAGIIVNVGRWSMRRPWSRCW
ncbi:hypothetical protein SASPL_112971 [Salvia splendens]|uniref:D-isomer specific 2-hydroxyacid dehydrogenase NAD-binding domain-containing protein n=1 Tax=Salvia splendens TaxID=180675 RepID=A0A8X8Y965_SALSN|nr:hypothetical protein SASPL_112971 [Salvia splendens]